jgi:hypothetical protein
MITSEFSKESLDKYIRREDVYCYKVLGEQHLRAHYLLTLQKKIVEGAFDFEKLRPMKIGGFVAYRPSKLGDELVLRKLNDVIRRVYKLKQADRNSVVRQVRVLLGEAVQKHVMKLDISSFYESIDREVILKRLEKDGFLSQKAIKLLKLFFNRVASHALEGVPRGIGLSATLAELCFRPVDEAARRLSGVYYYARYVDDIIVFSTTEPTSIKDTIKSLLPTGMELNPDKCKSFYVGCPCSIKCVHKTGSCPCLENCKCTAATPKFCLDYLGYGMHFENLPKPTKGKEKESLHIEVELARKKITRIKTRIVKALMDHVKVNDYSLLHLRLRFLTENHRIHGPDSRGKLKSGIYFRAVDEIT